MKKQKLEWIIYTKEDRKVFELNGNFNSSFLLTDIEGIKAKYEEVMILHTKILYV